jgi:hypothetical protein
MSQSILGEIVAPIIQEWEGRLNEVRANVSNAYGGTLNGPALEDLVWLERQVTALSTEVRDLRQIVGEQWRRQAEEDEAQRWESIAFVGGFIHRSPSTIRQWVKRGWLRGRQQVPEEGGLPTLHVPLYEAQSVSIARAAQGQKGQNASGEVQGS